MSLRAGHGGFEMTAALTSLSSVGQGAGRETFVRLATCFLRAAGAISREEVVWATWL